MKVALLLLAGLAAGCLAEGGEAEADVVVDLRLSRYAFTPGTQTPIEVQQGSVVLLRLTSDDITHGLSILEYGIHEQVPPGAVVEVRFVADEAGAFTIFCTVFCGTDHPLHKGTLHVSA